MVQPAARRYGCMLCAAQDMLLSGHNADRVRWTGPGSGRDPALRKDRSALDERYAPSRGAFGLSLRVTGPMWASAGPNGSVAPGVASWLPLELLVFMAGIGR